MKIIFNLLYSEVLKLKKCYLLLCIIASGMIMPIVSFIRYLLFFPKITLQNYISLNEMVTFTVMILIIANLLCCYIFFREHMDNTATTLYSYPISKISIVVSKIIIICAILVLIYFIHFALLFGGALILHKIEYLVGEMPFDKEFILAHFKIHLTSMILVFSLVPFLVFITNLFKNFISSVVLGVLASIINLFILETDLGVYYPLSLPITQVFHPLDISIIVALALGYFIIGMLLCIYQFTKIEEL